ncbi:ABC transporter permease [Aestuariimicrobium ganziense]|uniref:ABC transporter permease n=1 Tax=Aestuariimicrobium ganziense TaxID=2773677 RepID=UPI0019436061|nr:ABC transporter permease [Aestuariimicrobium ganziense]
MRKATFGSLWSRKLRLLMAVTAIVLGVAFVSASFVFSDMLKGSFDQIIKGSIPDVQVAPDTSAQVDGAQAGRSRLTPEVIERVKQVPGVTSAHGEIAGMGVMMIDTKGKALATFGPPQLGFNWATAPAYGGQDGVTLYSGHEPQADDQIVVDPESLRKSGHSLGDRVKVITPNAGTIEVTVVGTGAFGEGGTAGASYTFFTTQRAQELFLGGENTFTGAWVVTAPDADRVKVASDIQQVLPAGYAARDGDSLAKEQETSIGQALNFVNIFLLVFAGISLLVATFLIVNTFTILVAQRSRELAMFRAMGASRGQIRGMVLAEALVMGVVGSIIGLFAGVLLAQVIKVAMAAGGWDIGDAPISLGLNAVIASLATGIVVTLIAALGPARRATRIAPIEAMTRAQTESDQGLGRRAVVGVAMALAGAAALVLGLFVDVPSPVTWAGVGMALAMIGVAVATPMLGRPVVWLVGKVYRALFGEVGKLAELNSVRQPRRTAATASALMIGLTLVSLMAIFGASSSKSVAEQVNSTVRGDFMVARQGFQEFPAQVNESVSKVEQVDRVYAMKAAMVYNVPEGQAMPPQEYLNDVTGRHMTVVGGMEADSLDQAFPQRITEGRMFSAPGEMIVEADTAAAEKLGLGSVQRVYSPQAQRVLTLTVVGIYTRGDGSAIVEKWVSTKTLTDIGLGQQDMFLSIHLKPGADHAAARKALDETLADMPLVSVMDVNEYTDLVLQQVDQTMALLYALLALSIVIAVLGIVNTLGLSIVERTRELGLLRAIALTRGQVRRMITLESVVISLLGAIVGVGLGTVFGISLQRLMADDGINRLDVPVGQLVAFVIAAAVVGVLAAVWPAHRAARTNVLEAIASE